MMEHGKPAIEAPTLWGREASRPHCPTCQMRMMLVAAVQADRHYQCLRCGQADAIIIER
jgi:hypothetical protein